MNKISLKSKDGSIKAVVLNEHVILTAVDDTVIIDIYDITGMESKLIFIFEDSGKENSFTTSLSENEMDLTFKLHKWFDTIAVESTGLVELGTFKDVIHYIKFRTSANLKANMRSFHITIFKNI